MAQKKEEDDDEYNFDDDDLDDIPVNTLQQLEQEAILLTQQQQEQRRAQYQKPRTRLGQQQNDVPPGPFNQPQQQAYEIDQEDVIDLDEQPFGRQTGQAVRWSQERRAYGNDDDDNGNSEKLPDQYARRSELPPYLHVGDLQTRLRELEDQNSKLQRVAAEAQERFQAKSGEVAIVRQKFEKSARDYEQRVQSLRQSHSDEISRQKAELDLARKDRDRIKTDNRFLEHDLKARNLPKNIGAGVASRSRQPDFGSATSTPRKNKPLALGDGFDDDDFSILSPSKFKDRSKPSTPKAGAKRKRNAGDQSPVPLLALSLSDSKPLASPSRPSATEEAQGADSLLARLSKEEGNHSFLQDIISHHVLGSSIRTLEALSRHAFPSAPDKNLASVVIGQLSLRAFTSGSVNLPGIFCDIIFSLWDQALEENFHAVIDLIVDILRFVVDSQPFSFVRTVTEKAVPLAMATADLVAIPIGRAAIGEATPADSMLPEVDAAACLALLHSIAQSCSPVPESINIFWRLLKFDFVLLTLMKAQPLRQIRLMLHLLRTSALPSTFGAIVDDDRPGRQEKRESDTIDRLTLLLSETPKHPSPEEAIQQNELLGLRLSILSVLTTMSLTPHGGRLLAIHRHALGRLIRFLCDAIFALYTPCSDSARSLTIKCVNITTRLVFHVVTTFREEVDMRTKMAVIHGGAHKHYIALARLAFYDGVVLEDGIEQEVSDAAHQLLDEFLSPVEGEALLTMFSSNLEADG